MTRELFKSHEEPADISHFMRSAQQRMRARVVFDWLTEELKEAPLTANELEQRFIRQFCEQTPKIMRLSGLGYCPESSEDLNQHLQQFVEEQKLLFSDSCYRLPGERH